MNISETTQEKKARIIHSLSFASNSGFGKVFEDESTCQKLYKKLQNYVTAVSKKVLSDKRTQEYIGDDWETVWGPVVYSHDKNSSFARADNTMGVYYSKAEKLFVIAIAGTNSISSFGWMKEDFHVNKTAVWNKISGKGMGDISQGTATGLDILAHKMKDGTADILSALKKYIVEKNISKAEVAVTGHSLGGALSPALALYLSDKRTEWNNGKNIKISTYPTAGPTIGVYSDDDSNNFIKYYKDQIKEGNIEYHTVMNSLDIVPMAWDKNDLAKIPNLYPKIIDSTSESENLNTMALVSVLNTLKNKKTKEQYVYKHVDDTRVKRKFNVILDWVIKEVFKKINKKKTEFIPESLHSSINNLEKTTRFFVQAAYQHTKAYDKLLGITEFMKQYKKVAGEVSINDANAPEVGVNSEQMIFGLASEAVGFDINSLLELSELSDEELKKLIEQGEE